MLILIAGAGCGGLATAIALGRDGHDVTVIERAPALTEVGAGVVLGAHAMRALNALGAADHIRALNDPPQWSTFYDMVSGDLRVKTALGDTGKALYGATTYTTHRRDLIDALAGQLGNVSLRLDSEIVDVTQDDREVVLTLADGERLHGDLLVGADGLKSTVRSAAFGESPAVFTGFLAWRTVMPIEALGHDLPPRTGLWIGAGRHVVHYPIRKGTQFYAAFYVPADEIHRENWSISGDITELRASFADACDDIRNLTNAITEAFITGIYYREPIEQWHKGRIVLVGDAAHPVLPTSGSGAAVALEDSVALVGCLRRHPGNHAQAFTEFEARRKPRTTRLLLSSRADLMTYHESNPIKIKAAGPMNRGIMRLDPQGFQRIEWLYGYDEPTESQKSFESFSRDAQVKPTREAARRAFDLWAGALKWEDSIDGWVSERAAFDSFLNAQFPAPDDVEIEDIDCNGCPALRVVPSGGAEGPILLYLHGGSFIYGSAQGYARLAAAVARRIGGWALVPDFRRVPDHNAEAMQDDVRATLEWAQAQGRPIFICADGSGANLALAALSRNKGNAPLALYLLSPFADPGLTAASIDGNQRTEALLTHRHLLFSAGAYIQDHAPDAAIVAPLHGEMTNLPPTVVFAAAGEALVDDARAIVSAAQLAGVEARLHIVQDSVHAYALFDFLPETEEFLTMIGEDAATRLPATIKA